MSKPSDTELVLLKQLWSDGRLSARELHDRIERNGWSYSSTRKTLDRMAEKGFVRVENLHGINTYLPGIDKVETFASLIRNFSNTLLGQPAGLPAAAFAGNDILNDEEIAELEKLLEQFDEEKSK